MRDFDAKAHIICQLYAKALAYYAQGRLVLCGDEKRACKCWSAKPPPNLRSQGDANGVNMSTFATARAS